LPNASTPEVPFCGPATMVTVVVLARRSAPVELALLQLPHQRLRS
jgi:hypothetical protein